jgi:hypothetical protein
VVLAGNHPTVEETVPPAKKKGRSSAASAAPTAGEHVVVVRVYDRSENVATAKVVTK